MDTRTTRSGIHARFPSVRKFLVLFHGPGQRFHVACPSAFYIRNALHSFLFFFSLHFISFCTCIVFYWDRRSMKEWKQCWIPTNSCCYCCCSLFNPLFFFSFFFFTIKSLINFRTRCLDLLDMDWKLNLPTLSLLWLWAIPCYTHLAYVIVQCTCTIHVRVTRNRQRTE